VSLTIGGGASWLIALRNVSCIMLELFVRKPVFQGNDEIHQLEAIYEIMGTPTEEEWPGLASMPWYELVKPKEVLPSRFDEYFSKYVPPLSRFVFPTAADLTTIDDST
jgi:hypothetical protein